MIEPYCNSVYPVYVVLSCLVVCRRFVYTNPVQSKLTATQAKAFRPNWKQTKNAHSDQKLPEIKRNTFTFSHSYGGLGPFYYYVFFSSSPFRIQRNGNHQWQSMSTGSAFFFFFFISTFFSDNFNFSIFRVYIFSLSFTRGAFFLFR